MEIVTTNIDRGRLLNKASKKIKLAVSIKIY